VEIARAKHLAHASGAERLEDAIVGDRLPVIMALGLYLGYEPSAWGGEMERGLPCGVITIWADRSQDSPPRSPGKSRSSLCEPGRLLHGSVPLEPEA